MGRKRAIALAAVIGWAGCAAVSDPVDVTTPEGLSLQGDILGYDGRHLRLETIYGPMLVDLERADCVGAACPDPERFVPDIRLSGETSVARLLLPALVEAYGRQGGFEVRTVDGVGETIFLISERGEMQLRLRLKPSSSEQSFAELLSGEAQMVVSAREVRTTERVLFQEAGLGDLTDDGQSQILGISGLVPVISPRRSLRRISLDDLARVISGEIRDFEDLGGAPGPITLYLGPDHNGFEQAFEDKVLAPMDLSLRADPIRLDDETDLSRQIADDRNGFGVVRTGRTGAAQPLMIAGECGLSTSAQDVLLMTEDYPLTLPVFLYFPDLPRHDSLNRFIEWLASPAAARVAGRTGLAGLTADEIPIGQQGERLANAIRQAGEDVSLAELQRLLRVIDGGVRLTPTFRFEVGSTRLDAQSRANVRRLAAEISAGRYAGQQLLLIGFSDARGPASENRDLSSARAESVMRRLEGALTGTGGAELQTAAFGEALPMACDDTEAGRQVNRRVEVWLTPKR